MLWCSQSFNVHYPLSALQNAAVECSTQATLFWALANEENVGSCRTLHAIEKDLY